MVPLHYPGLSGWWLSLFLLVNMIIVTKQGILLELPVKSKLPLCLMSVQRRNIELSGVYLCWCHYHQFFSVVTVPFLCSITWQRLEPSSHSLSSSQRSSVCSTTAWPRDASSTASSSSLACAPCCRSPSVSGQSSCCWFISLFTILWRNILLRLLRYTNTFIRYTISEHAVG